VLDVLDRLVCLGRGGPVVHGQEDPGHGLREEREQRRGAERVEPVRAVGDLAVEEAAQEGTGPGALVDPPRDRDRHVDQRLAAALTLGLLLALEGQAVAALAQVAVAGPAVPGGRSGSLATAPERPG